MIFTMIHFRNFEAFNRVRDSGLYNIFSSEARQATLLSREDYLFVMENYDKLEAAYEEWCE